MLNQFLLVGRIVKNIKNNNVTIAITRNHKNENGEYETDFIDVIIKGSIAKTTAEYCKKGDIIGVKGSIQSNTSKHTRKIILIAEKVTFLSSKKED